MRDGRVMLPNLLLAVLAGLSIAAGAPTPQAPVYEIRTLDVHLVYASNDTRHRVVTAAIVRVPFDQPLFLRREGMNDTLTIDDLHPANDLAGLAELECGEGRRKRVFRSPALPNATADSLTGPLPITLVPLRHVRAHGIGELFTVFEHALYEQPNAYSALLFLEWTSVDGAKRTNLSPAKLGTCAIKFLARDEQRHAPRGELTGFRGQPIAVDKPLALPDAPHGPCKRGDAVRVLPDALSRSRVLHRRAGSCVLPRTGPAVPSAAQPSPAPGSRGGEEDEGSGANGMEPYAAAALSRASRQQRRSAAAAAAAQKQRQQQQQQKQQQEGGGTGQQSGAASQGQRDASPRRASASRRLLSQERSSAESGSGEGGDAPDTRQSGSDSLLETSAGAGAGASAAERAAMGEGGVVMSSGQFISAVELDDMVGENTQMVDQIMEPVVNLILQPAMDQMAKQTEDTVADKLANKLSTGIKAKVPTEVSEMLDLALTYNLTNLMTDSVTQLATELLTTSVDGAVSGTITTAVSQAVMYRLPAYLRDRLPPTIAERVTERLPEMLHRTLRIRLAHSLTRSVTHAVVPALVKALTHSPHQEYFCKQCYHKGEHCQLCHYSAANEYYTSYYATYYSDYYSDYYADYYVQSLHKLDLAQHPRREWKIGKEPGDPKSENLA